MAPFAQVVRQLDYEEVLKKVSRNIKCSEKGRRMRFVDVAKCMRYCKTDAADMKESGLLESNNIAIQ